MGEIPGGQHQRDQTLSEIKDWLLFKHAILLRDPGGFITSGNFDVWASTAARHRPRLNNEDFIHIAIYFLRTRGRMLYVL